MRCWRRASSAPSRARPTSTPIIAAELDGATDFQDMLDRARRIGHEQAFLIGVRVLTGSIGAAQAGGAYALLAERMIAAMQAEVEREMAKMPRPRAGRGDGRRRHGQARRPGDDGRLRPRPHRGLRLRSRRHHVGRPQAALPHPLLHAPDAAADQRAGVARRRRATSTRSTCACGPPARRAPWPPSCRASSTTSSSDAWTWEHLALTRARVVSGPPALRAAVEQAIRGALTRQRDAAKTAADVRDMRALIEKEKGTGDIWELKQVRGGLVDLEFIAQYLQLVHAHAHPEVLSTNTVDALVNLERAGLLSAPGGGRPAAGGAPVR